MSNNEKLIRKIDFFEAEKISLIFSTLNQDFFEDTVDDKQSELSAETTDLNSEKVKILRELLKILVENSDEFATEIEEILAQNRKNIAKDITIVTDGIAALIEYKEIGTIIAFLLARDLIRAFKPSEEIVEREVNKKDGTTKTKKIIRRKYNADLIALAKAYFESKKDSK